MKKKLLTMLIVFTIMFSVLVGSASAQAYTTHFTTSITYVNVGTATTTTLDLLFYANPGDTAPVVYSLPALAPNAAGSISVGNIGDVPAGFQGDAIMQSDQPMLVTLVQVPQSAPTVKNRALSNGFSAGASTSFVATVLKNYYDYNTIFSVQNADSELNTVHLAFYNTSAALVYEFDQDLEAGAPFYVDAGTLAGLGTTFNGSAVLTATRAAGGPGVIVSSAMELGIANTGLKAFEGVASGGMKFYMPSALCNAYGASTAYAIQNTSLTDATEVTVTYTDQDGTVTSETKNVGAGAKQSFQGCPTMGNGKYGAAVVEAATQPIIAIGKAFDGAGITTAFNGVEVGYQKFALPYVRWATDTDYNSGAKQRTFLTIQNVGAALAAGDVITVDYVDYLGNIAGTHTYTVPAGGMPNGSKFSSNPTTGTGLVEFGYYGSNYGGAAVITGPTGSQLTAVARVSSLLSIGHPVSEDYNSQPVP
jgi:hypothetical protein